MKATLDTAQTAFSLLSSCRQANWGTQRGEWFFSLG